MLTIRDLSKVFQIKNTQLTALNEINLTIEDGAFVSLLGPSGCGKSTLLALIAGLTAPTSGEISLNHKVVTKPGADKGVVFQEAALFPWLDVLENVKFPLKKKYSKREQNKIAKHYLHKVQLTKFLHHYPHELSGGMQQRVSIARALAMDPELLLMDEPFGALDEQTRQILQEELEHIWLETEKTIVFVTHSIREAIKLSDRIIVMGARPGRIIDDININLARPRQQNEMIALEEKINKLLEVEIKKVLKEELYDSSSA